MSILGRAGRYGRQMRSYWRAADSARDYVRLLRVRLSLSAVGGVVCHRQISPTLHLREFGTVRLRSHTTDVSVLNELVVGRGYDEVLKHLPPSPGLIVDLGANIGLVSAWLLTRYPSSRIVAVEPEPGNVAVLRDNLAPFGTRASVVAACAGGASRKVRLFTNTGAWGYRMGDGDSGETDVLTLPQLLADDTADIDLLKCDIEGAERELFADCGGWIGRVNVLLAECHDGYTADDLERDVSRGGASFDRVHFHRDARYGHDTVILSRRASFL